jgi:hypothetical protein
MYSATLINGEHPHPSRASRGSSALADPALGSKPVAQKRGHQDTHTLIGSDDHYSVNTDDDHNTSNISDEDPRPAKRRKLHLAPAVTPPPLVSPSRVAFDH